MVSSTAGIGVAVEPALAEEVAVPTCVAEDAEMIEVTDVPPVEILP